MKTRIIPEQSRSRLRVCVAVLGKMLIGYITFIGIKISRGTSSSINDLENESNGYNEEAHKYARVAR